MIMTVEIARKLTTISPFGSSANPFPCIHSSRRSCTAVMQSVFRIQVLPGAPFPNDFASGRDLDQIIAVHFAVVFRAYDAALDLGHDLRRQSIQTKQQYVAVAQSDAVVMVIGMANFPQNASVPVRFERRTAFPWLFTDEARGIFYGLAVVK